MMHRYHQHRFPLLLSLLLALLLTAAVSGSLLAQNPNSCKISGLMSYSVVVNYDPNTDRTTFDFTFYNNTPVFDDPPGIFIYANIGRIYIYGLPDAFSTQEPAGYDFIEVGQNHSWQSTADPWWTYPPSIPPGGSLSGFQYVVEGEFDAGDITAVVDQFQGMDPDDPTWQTPGPQGGFDCATLFVAPNPDLEVTKTVSPTTAGVGQIVTYTYRLCNTGNRVLQITQYLDNTIPPGNLLDEFIEANNDSDLLPIGECVQFTVQYTVQAGDIPSLENCVNVIGVIPGTTAPVTDQDCATLSVTEEPPITRLCFVPVTFTVSGWGRFCCPYRPISIQQNFNGCYGDPLIPEGMVFSRFPIAFSCYKFFGEEFPNQLVLGNDVRITYIGKTSCLENLCTLLSGGCAGCGPIQQSVDCPPRALPELGGCLLQETIALLMNVAYNDMRLMPKTPGVDLECYTLNQGPLEGKTVGQVLFIANEVLSGRTPAMFGLIDCEQLLEVIRAINANYEFIDFTTTIDRGYLTPDRPFGQPLPPHCPELRDYSGDCIVGPCIRVTKTVNPLIARVGQTVTYKYKVCNCGPEDLANITVTDDLLGDLTALFVAANGGFSDLEATKCVEFTVDVVIPLTDAKSISNTVTVVGTGEETAVQDTDTAIVGILQDNPQRKCFLPTTFTKEGWARFCDPNNGIIQGGMIYTRFPQAFKCFLFSDRQGGMYQPLPNELRVGNSRIYIRFIGKTACLDRLCLLLQGDCQGCGKLRIPVDCPWRLTNTEGGGCLAVETIVLLMNVAYNDMRLMPRTKGVNLECYKIASGPLKGKTVAEVFNIANDLLQGKPPCMFGLVSCEQLVAILRQINANYEFVDFDTFIDRGFLIPDHPFDPLAPPRCPSVPMQCVNNANRPT